MSSKYGETHDIFNTHHTETKAKLDALLAKNTEIEINNDGVETLLTAGNVNHASIDAKVVACDTGACVVASSALPSGASTESKQDVGNASIASVDGKVVACNTGSVLFPVLFFQVELLIVLNKMKLKFLLVLQIRLLLVCLQFPVQHYLNRHQVRYQLKQSAVKRCIFQVKLMSLHHDIYLLLDLLLKCIFSHEVDLLVSDVSGGTFFKTSHSGYFMDGEFHLLVSNHPYKYVKVQVKNADGAPGNSADFTVHLLSSD
jgi:hypothetical protein